jgi:hypothetical protein
MWVEGVPHELKQRAHDAMATLNEKLSHAHEAVVDVMYMTLELL